MAPPTTFAQHLARHPFLILDGGLATQLEVLGCSLDDPLWSAKVLLEAPARVQEVHRRFADAGADIITTASYQATLPALRARGMDEAQARALLRASISLAREATPDALIAASVGSYGAYLADGSEYRGDYGLGRSALAAFHRERLRELCAGQPDLLAFETIPSAVEAEAIATLLAERDGPGAWVSFSLREDERPTICDGTPLARAIAPLLDHPRVLAVGVNCLGPRQVLPALELLTQHAPKLARIAYPNSGEGWAQRAWTGRATPPAAFAKLARTWFEAGADVIGGCCRTGPEHLRALASLRETLRTS